MLDGKYVLALRPLITIKSFEHCKQKWASKRFKWFYVLQDETEEWDDFKRVSKEDFDKRSNKDNVVIRIQTDEGTYQL